MRDRPLARDVWQVMGWPVDEITEIVLHSPAMIEFLTPWLRERCAEIDILEFEHEEPSA